MIIIKNTDYLIKRDDVMIGGLIKINLQNRKLFPEGQWIPSYKLMDSPTEKDYEDARRAFEPRIWHLDCKPTYGVQGCYEKCRSILFVLNEQKLANDLLYDCPNYPVFSLSELKDCENSLLVVNNPFKIGRVLEYLGYNEILEFKDIIHIKENILNDWILLNSTLFGVYPTGSHESGTEVYDKYGNHHTFNDVKDDGPIPESYFDAFWSYACLSGVNWFDKTNYEKKIKKLKN